ncbi:valine--tRNA ligase [Syntrophotalea acetylenica]|jgi:valyl-tRNA synthetase|uniref:Valine--tRNA ligase n=2 Tax=Syntrophotalea acetylenica TaxID=29542 RepID=A0A1L3GHZ1_SYNAC|nr:valine--tRNA ligase [Syntrophotalea acetylenica]APG25278.1 valine--tRNA ligase [Syntrophotalea acetylenica]APG43347.1 valine--tRNA ligase [Syntrophotalea acetylenica]
MEAKLPKGYEPHDVEAKWYEFWTGQGLFHADEHSAKAPFSIVIPPPNVTGVLHMGHALNNTLQDILVRWKRMEGYEVLWQPGTDHAGIATQNVVEKQLAAEDSSRHALGREGFIERVWQWREESGGQIINQLKRLGASCDWDRERFTMDEGLSRAVREVFVTLYEEGLIYRDNRLINWCPRCHTALSDLEVEHQDQKGNLWHLRYPVVGTDRYLVVATTRPETMLGDTAVAVHPDDERYADLIGKSVMLPLMERPIPIIADDYVDREFGSGAVKITPAHDFNDFEIGKRHNLEFINIFDASGVVNDNGGRYRGLERFEARKAVLADLEAAGLLERIEEHLNAVGECYRCKTVIEPYMSLQWYVKVQPLADKAIEAVQTGKTRIIPAQWEKTYFEWMFNIRDWCISRQIWWGHRIPAWFCEACNEITVSRQDPTACSHCGGSDLRQETDVLDTWFSSALWPFSTMGWPEKTETLQKFYPTSCLITGFDILFFWVARMMMMGLKFRGEVPFRDVYIHALVRDAQGQKMSKSKGNVIDPLTVIDEYGTDAFRFTLAAFAAQGRDVKLSVDRIAGYRNFVNKLWNASRFALMNLEGFEPDGVDLQQCELALSERWILSRLTDVVAEARQALTEYKFNEAASALYAFTWHEFCDWFIELSKDDLYGENAQRKKTAQAVLYTVLEQLLRLLHPFMPFVTEEIWQALPGVRPTVSIMAAPYADVSALPADQAGAAHMELIMEVIKGIRNIRGEMNVPPGKRITAVLDCKNPEISGILAAGEGYVRSLAKVDQLSCGEGVERPSQAATQVAGEVEILLPLAGLIDLDEELKRLEKEIAKVAKDIAMFSKKLSNESFLSKAPADVLEKDRQKLADAEEKAAILRQSLARISALK